MQARAIEVPAPRERLGLAVHRHPLLEQRCQLIGRKGLREEEALSHLAAELQEPLQLIGSLDAFGHRPEVQDVRELDHGLGERRCLATVVHAVDEGLVHLEDVDREPPQVAQRRVPGAEVVEGQLDAEPLERVSRSIESSSPASSRSR